MADTRRIQQECDEAEDLRREQTQGGRRRTASRGDKPSHDRGEKPPNKVTPKLYMSDMPVARCLRGHAFIIRAAPAPAPTAISDVAITIRITAVPRLASSYPESTIKPNHFAIEHRILDDGPHKQRVLARPA